VQERANIQAQIEETRRATDEQIAATRARYAAEQLEQEAADQRRSQREARNQALQDEQAKRVLDQQLRDIDGRIRAEKQAYDSINNQIRLMQTTGVTSAATIGIAFQTAAQAAGAAIINALANAVNRAGRDDGGSASFGGSSSRRGAGGGGGLAFAAGGTLPYGTPVGTSFTVGEKGMEMGRVTSRGIEFASAQRTQQMTGGGTVVNMDGAFRGANFGEVVTPSQLNEIVLAVRDGLLQAGIAG